jgi:hypothetical protein
MEAEPKPDDSVEIYHNQHDIKLELSHDDNSARNK